MASKFGVSNNSPAILDSIKKNTRTYLSETSQNQKQKANAADDINDDLDIAYDRTNEEYYDKLQGDNDLLNKLLPNSYLTPKQRHAFNIFPGASPINSEIETKRTNKIQSGIRPSYRLLYNDKLLSKYGIKRRKLPNLLVDKKLSTVHNKLHYNERQNLVTANSALELKNKLKSRYDVSLHNGITHLEETKKTHPYIEKVWPKNYPKPRKSKSSESQRSYLPLEQSAADTRALWSFPSEESLNSKKGTILDESGVIDNVDVLSLSGTILDESGVIDNVDVLSLSGKSTQFSSGVAIGLVGILLGVVIFIYWIKNVIFGLTNHKSSEKNQNVDFIDFQFEEKTTAKNPNKRNLLVFQKTLSQNSTTKVITRFTTHRTRTMDIDAGESNIDAVIGSNKSTPYFTPLGTLDEGSNRFEFPLPSPPTTSIGSNEEQLLSAASSPVSKPLHSSRVAIAKNATFDSVQSPTRRLRRCSLYERRSCSPQRSQVSNLLTNRSLCKSHMDSYEQLYNSAGIFSNPIHSAISAIALNSSPTPVDNPSRQFSFNRQNCRSPKIYENRVIDYDGDKENEIPIGGELYSPKLKSSDLILFQQNSPRILESSPTSASTNFSFSPKILDRSEIITAVKSSPLSSAGYKNGDYFKFPEVDCFSLDANKRNHLEKDELQPFQRSGNFDDKLKAADGKASRRARLKSISLDSEGAKLVEDNLGVPVEELIERASPVPSDFFTKSSPHQSSRYKGVVIHQAADQTLPSPQNDGFECPTQTQARTESHCKNKNNLTIRIGSSSSDLNQNQFQQKIDTPKTPTLVQTKQKAISLDSSDSKFSSSQRFIEEQNDYIIGGTNTDHRPMAVSLLHISSLSTPGTPKRQLGLHKNGTHLNRSKLTSPMSGGSQKSKGRKFSSSKSLTTSTASTSSFDHSKSSERQGFILKLDSFNENTMDDADYDEEEAAADGEDDDNYFLNFDEVAVINEDNADNGEANVKTANPDYLLGTTSLQTQKCTTVLSLSNSNLKTLPEIMTLSDFSISNRENDIRIEKGLISAAGYNPLSGQKHTNFIGGRQVRSSLLQRRGSNHSLTLNLNGSYGSLSKGLSTSNYSLGSNSQYNLSNSIYNLSQHQPGPFKAGQTVYLKGNPVGISAYVQNSNAMGAPTNISGEKKNLLQRRGSNTSLTLNIHGSPCVNLNRFNSHSSLNITSQQQQSAFKVQQLKDAGETTDSHKSKKGLLQRRGSNASLTINLQSNALAVSNINLRGSACSLSSINTTQLEEEYENHRHQETAYDLTTNSGQHRKFFSSENLNNLNGMSQYSRLNQAHVRSSTNTCFGSVSDLKPYCQLPLSLIIGEEQETHFKNQLLESKNTSGALCLNLTNTKGISPDSPISTFKQSNLCSCTGVRNITTRPLSPQTTSEDFKMYLANIQLLQNASNVLNEYDLMKLNYVFDKSYGHGNNDPDNRRLEQFEEKQWRLILCTDTQFKLPSEDEQKRLMLNLHQEFWDLPTNHQEKPMVFGSQTKNRYKSILPNEHSRVQLIPEEGSIEAPYINANYIKGPDYVHKSYIATQGPLPNTIYEFWLMVFQNIRKYDDLKVTPTTCTKSTSTTGLELSSPFETEFQNDSSIKLNDAQQKIVMLTNFVENNRQKCSAYFPIDENEIFLITYTNDQIKNPQIEFFYNKYFEDLKLTQSTIETFRIEINDQELINHLPKMNYFIVKNKGIIMKNGFSIRQLHCLLCCNIRDLDDLNEKRIQVVHRFICYHYWYPDWPDHRSPNDISVLLEISQHLLALGKCEAEFYYGSNSERLPCFSFTENNNDQPLPIIHCSAGIGRTGCMAAILNAICQIRASLSPMAITCSKQMAIIPMKRAVANNNSSIYNKQHISDVDNLQSFPSQSFPYSKLESSGKILKNSKAPSEDISGYIVLDRSNKIYCEAIKKKPNIYVDILGIVCNLRLQRGGMVQNSEQYELIHRAMCLYLKRVLKYIHETRKP